MEDVVNMNPLLESCVELTEKGIFCFDIFDYNSYNYKKIVEPTIEIYYPDLPEEIKKILKNHFVISTDVKKSEVLYVKHAY